MQAESTQAQALPLGGRVLTLHGLCPGWQWPAVHPPLQLLPAIPHAGQGQRAGCPLGEAECPASYCMWPLLLELWVPWEKWGGCQGGDRTVGPGLPILLPGPTQQHAAGCTGSALCRWLTGKDTRAIPGRAHVGHKP